MQRIRASNLENILLAIEGIVENDENLEKATILKKLQKHSQGIPNKLFYEFVEIAKILVTPSTPNLGHFVVMTGVDKSGKETQAFNQEHIPGIFSLFDYLVSGSYRVLRVALPSYNTTPGSLIANYLEKENSTIEIIGNLSETTAWVLWSLDRAQHNPQIENWLKSDVKNVVLSKRWTETNVVYQKSLGISEERILRLERNLVRADYTIVLDIPVKLTFERMKISGETPDKYENPEFLSKVSDIYMNIERFYPYGKIFHIDGSGSFKEVNKRLLKVVSSIESDWSHITK